MNWCSVDDFFLDGWKTKIIPSCGHAEPHRNSYVPSNSGNWALDMNAKCVNAINQQIPPSSLVDGRSYTLSLFLNRNNNCGDFTDKTVQVQVTGYQPKTFTYGAFERHWRQVTYQFTATGADPLVTIEIASLYNTGSPYCGPMVDDVTLLEDSDDLAFSNTEPRLVSSDTSSSSNLIANGDFENNLDSLCLAAFCDVEDSVIAPWTTIIDHARCGMAEPVSKSYWPPAHGNWSMDLAANCGYTLKQRVNLIKGKSYTLSLMLNHNTDDAGHDKTLIVSATGVASKAFTFSASEWMWRRIIYHFVATQEATDIYLGADPHNPGWDACGPAIDMVDLREDAVGSIGSTSTTFSSLALPTSIYLEAGRVAVSGSLDDWKNCTMDSECNSGNCHINSNEGCYSVFCMPLEAEADEEAELMSDFETCHFNVDCSSHCCSSRLFTDGQFRCIKPVSGFPMSEQCTGRQNLVDATIDLHFSKKQRNYALLAGLVTGMVIIGLVLRKRYLQRKYGGKQQIVVAAQTVIIRVEGGRHEEGPTQFGGEIVGMQLVASIDNTEKIKQFQNGKYVSLRQTPRDVDECGPPEYDAGCDGGDAKR